jgi:hypothetical protein
MELYSFKPSVKVVVVFALLVQVVTISGCASKPESAYNSIPVNEDELAQTNPTEVINRAAALFDRAENHDLEFYSPVYYQEALRALTDARSALASNQNKSFVIRAAIASRQLLERAQQVRAQVDRNLKNLIKHRNLLIELEAERWQSAKWRAVSEEINELVRLIEDDKIQEALSREPGVREDMYELEVDTLLASSLKDARDTLLLAENQEARTYSPKYFNQADILIDDTEIYIRANYRDRKGIAERAEQARLAAERAYKTALDAQTIFALDASEAEAYFTSIQSLIDSIVRELQEESLAPYTVKEALSALNSIVKEHLINARAPSSAPTIQGAPSPSAEIEVLEVLETIQLDEQPIQNELEEDEQGFDEIEFVGEPDS